MHVRSILYAFFGILVWSFCSTLAAVNMTDVQVDGRRVDFPAVSSDTHADPAPFRIPASTKSLTFQFQSESNAPVRLRYKLEGHDVKWQDLGADMNVWLRLLDRQGKNIDGSSEKVTGQTPAWQGLEDDTPLVPRHIELPVQAAATQISVFFISMGSRDTLGILLADEISVQVKRPGQDPPEIHALNPTAGERMENPLGTPAQWGRQGDKPGIAQLRWRVKPVPHPVLVLDDEDPNQFGVWRSRDIMTPLSPGDRVSLNWQTAYSIGKGGSGTVTYSGLKPGNYWFRVAAVKADGQPTGEEISLPLIVVPPLLHRPVFWLNVCLILGIILVCATRQVTKHRMQQRIQQQLAILENRRALEAERARIARDIHDDLGSTLSQIAMLSEMAKEEKPEGPERQLLGNIFNHAQQATRALDETIWAIRPSNDTLSHLIEYLCQFVENHLQLAGLRFRLDVPDTIPDFSLTSLERQNLLLATKEALHNVVKHARATEVWLRIRVSGDVLSLRIEDNGSGEVPSPDAAPTRGSDNMRKRMEQINGCYTRTGVPGQGTIVEFQVQMRRSGSEP